MNHIPDIPISVLHEYELSLVNPNLLALVENQLAQQTLSKMSAGEDFEKSKAS